MLALSSFALASSCAHLSPSQDHHDLVIYGGTSARVTLSNEGVNGHVIADSVRCLARP